ncbi:MarR family winged helix-turn-helix transcriptional regulator [Devosia sp.]|uniref:MarR family winged helix-turn-helix transcriptional regulator n=1 Tax=Devosia sp. TaxID=1871048 RepID=UPI002FCB3FAD
MLNSRMAARAITRRADQKLRAVGITAAQFTILGVLSRRDRRSITDLADSIAMDRSTLSRNLQLLESKAIVASRSAQRGNGRIYDLTAEGEALMERALPVWQALQTELRQTLANPDFPTVLSALRQVARL